MSPQLTRAHCTEHVFHVFQPSSSCLECYLISYKYKITFTIAPVNSKAYFAMVTSYHNIYILKILSFTILDPRLSLLPWFSLRL